MRVKESCWKGKGKKVERVKGDMKMRVRLVNGGGEVAGKIFVTWSGMDKRWTGLGRVRVGKEQRVMKIRERLEACGKMIGWKF